MEYCLFDSFKKWKNLKNIKEFVEIAIQFLLLSHGFVAIFLSYIYASSECFCELFNQTFSNDIFVLFCTFLDTNNRLQSNFMKNLQIYKDLTF